MKNQKVKEILKKADSLQKPVRESIIGEVAKRGKVHNFWQPKPDGT